VIHLYALTFHLTDQIKFKLILSRWSHSTLREILLFYPPPSSTNVGDDKNVLKPLLQAEEIMAKTETAVGGIQGLNTAEKNLLLELRLCIAVRKFSR
jgi:hypothetical protein